jgi:hypothetical protein
MTFSNLGQILTHRFVGKYCPDSAAFDALGDFCCRDDVLVADKRKALHHMVKVGMNIDEPVGKAELAEFIREHRAICEDRRTRAR